MTELLERRTSIPTDMLAVITLVTELHKDIKALDAKLEIHMINETHELAAEVAKLMAAAFPEGDPHGHKAAHLAWIHKTEARAEFWEKLKYELSKWGLIGFFGWAIVALWQHFLQGPQ